MIDRIVRGIRFRLLALQILWLSVALELELESDDQ